VKGRDLEEGPDDGGGGGDGDLFLVKNI